MNVPLSSPTSLGYFSVFPEGVVRHTCKHAYAEGARNPLSLEMLMS